MAELGFTTDIQNLTAEKADILSTIAIELDKAQADESLARSKRGRK
jgi:hypothetical protein